MKAGVPDNFRGARRVWQSALNSVLKVEHYSSEKMLRRLLKTSLRSLRHAILTISSGHSFHTNSQIALRASLVEMAGHRVSSF